MTRPEAHMPLGGAALFAAMLSAAGLPLYIHAPKFFAETYGISLALLGVVLGGLRLLDVVQDPLLGWLARRTAHRRAATVPLAAALMALGMLGLFAIPPFFAPLAWFAVMLTLVFSAFSFLTICFYAQGVSGADALPGQGHLTLARWRETGALLGICAASIAPLALGFVTPHPFAGFALGFALLASVAVIAMQYAWQAETHARGQGFAPILRDPIARRLLLLALVNAAPAAVSSTLFLYFTESRLMVAPGTEGALLLLFFLASAASVPLWSRAAERIGIKPVLLAAMALAIASFSFAATLGPGDTLPFAVICLLSGAAIGADMTLLPAAFAARLAQTGSEAEGFGLWAFMSKSSLALAALVVLPWLDASGFTPGTENSPAALWRLTWLYALFPCALKCLAVLLLAATPLTEKG